ncbi:MAG: hypothetical protein QNK04_00240 [Myxococcota bacterium]|nr:hypothetical protein [Myxococcota bacterium]
MMDCRRSQEIDLPAFLADSRDAAFADFRAHYPGCRDCSAELRIWTELHEALAAPHPEPERLARYAELEPAERATIDRHTVRCPGCREELAALAAFEPALLRAAAPVAASAPSLLDRLRKALVPVRRVVWHPAFAYALVGLLLLPVVQRLGSPPPDPGVGSLFSTARESAPMGGVAPAPAEQTMEIAADTVAPAARPAKKMVAEAPAPAQERLDRSFAAADARERADEAPDPVAGDRLEPAPQPGALAGLLQEAREGVVDEEVRPESRSPPAFARFTTAAEPEDVLQLEAWRTPDLALSKGAGVVRILLPLPDELPPGEVFATVREPEARRERREPVTRLPGEDGSGELRVPRDWLTPGRYRVQVEGGDAPALGFRVLAPN